MQDSGTDIDGLEHTYPIPSYNNTMYCQKILIVILPAGPYILTPLFWSETDYSNNTSDGSFTDSETKTITTFRI